jgi:hypothetical protein
MSIWTAEDFKFVRERMKEIETEEANILTTTGSKSQSSDVSRIADDFGTINEKIKALEE